MNNEQLAVTLVIFTCSGRENLLIRTISSFREHCNYKFEKILLAVDGSCNAKLEEEIPVDLILTIPKRSGYVNSIAEVIPHVKTPYFFWLEDDWKFLSLVNIPKYLHAMNQHNNLMQIVLAKEDYELFNGLKKISNDIFSRVSFSANPSLCRTADLKLAIQQMVSIPKSADTKWTGFENYFDEYMQEHTKYGWLIFHSDSPIVSHEGFVESTPREFHMINSLDSTPTGSGKEYVSGFGHDRAIGVPSKISMVFKLCYLFITVIVGQLFSRKLYDFALRIFIAFKTRS